MQLMRKRGLFENSKVVFVQTKDILPNPSQPRKSFEREALAELSESISRYGVLQPLTVRKTSRGIELVAGERRLRAAVLAGLSEVPCMVLDIDSEESALIALVENLQRRDLDFIEEAEGLAKLVQDYGMTQEEISRRIGKSQPAVANKLRILKLPGEILYLVREAGLSERHARALLKLKTDEDRVKVLDYICKNNLNVAQTEKYIDMFMAASQEEKKKKNKPIFVLKDIRLFLNTLEHSLSIMRQSGVEAEYGKSESDKEIILTITIPKNTEKKQMAAK